MRFPLRPEGQTAKQWLTENGIREQSYYCWQRRIRQEVFERQKQEQELLPAAPGKAEISFAEIPISAAVYSDANTQFRKVPATVIRTGQFSIELSNSISLEPLAGIIRKVIHA